MSEHQSKIDKSTRQRYTEFDSIRFAKQQIPSESTYLDSGISLANSRLTITVNELAQHLHVSRATAYKLARHQDFYPAFRIGNRLIISVQALTRWLAEQTEGKL